MTSWAGTGEAYAASYEELCAGTVDAVLDGLGNVDAGTLLDVGAGTGHLARICESRGWAVTGCEPEATMRQVAQRRHPQISFVAGALPDLPFDDGTFDAVTANFVLNHVPDPRESAREMGRVARAAGVLVATTWLVSPSALWAEVTERSGLPPASGSGLPRGKGFERSTAGFAEMLRDAQWQDVRVTELTWVWRAQPDALWRSVEGGVASAGAFYAGLSAPDRSRFRDAFEAVSEDREVDGTIPLQHTAAIAVGRSA